MDEVSVEPDEPRPAPVLRSIIERPRTPVAFVVALALLVATTAGLVGLLFHTAHELMRFTE